MNVLNVIFCGKDVKNTGVCDCYFTPELLEGSILVPRDLVLTQDQLSDANISTTLTNLTKTTKTNRIFPTSPFVQITDNTEEPVEQTFGYGDSVPIRDGKINWIFQFIEGGITHSNALASFNNLIKKYAVIFRDGPQNTLIGTTKKDVNGQNGMAGIPLTKLRTYPWKAPTGSEVTAYRIQFGFNPVYINQLIAFRKVDLDVMVLSELKGLENVLLSHLAGDEGDTEITIGAVTDCGADMATDYSEELEQVTAWIWKDAAGAVKTITGVVFDEETGGWTLTTSDPSGAEDGDTIQMAAPTVLEAPPINVAGYESDILTLDLGS